MLPCFAEGSGIVLLHPWLTAPDVDRAVPALNAFVQHLDDDPRVAPAFVDWQHRADADAMRWHQSNTPPTSTDLRTLRQIDQMHNEPRDLAAGGQLCAAMKIPYTWSPFVVVNFFRAAADGYQIVFVAGDITDAQQPGESQIAYAERVIAAAAAHRHTDRPTKRPTARGDRVVRDVTWWYRTRIQPSPDTIGALARAYVPTRGERTSADARSVVRRGIHEADALFTSIALYDPGWRPPSRRDPARRTAPDRKVIFTTVVPLG
jgi:hypothetical protein